MSKHLRSRILCLALAVVMVLGLFPTVSAAPADLSWKLSDAEISPDRSDRLIRDTVSGEATHKPTDLVRVSIVLEDTPTLRAGYPTKGLAANPNAAIHDLKLQKVQKSMEKTISAQALDGKPLDVVWNLTLVSNIISANVPYGKIEAIRSVKGVRDVIIERQYAVDTAQPNTATSWAMTGASAVWQTGLTGAGTRIAIIDTGTDTDHQSFDNGAYLYALSQNAADNGMDPENYTTSLDLLDAGEIAAVLEHLNAYERIGGSAAQYYINEKLPFGANYVDYNLTVNHDSDSQGSHGSHVAGIAAANRYIPDNGGYSDALQTVFMSGVAPDAQIITLKVFGYNPGPYDSDYFAAIEDAIWLGCDSVNLSLGSGAPGVSDNPLFADLLDYMATTDTVVVMSAGNSGNWAENTANGYLYSDGVSFHTSGTPGTYTNSLAVASVDNDGTVGMYLDVAGHTVVYTEGDGLYNHPITSLDTSYDNSGTSYDYIFIDGVGLPEDYNGLDLFGKVVFCSRGDISFVEKATNAAQLGAAALVVYNNTSGVFGMDLTDYRLRTPCVSIIQKHADAIRNASVMQTTDDGLIYYTGSLTISRKLGTSLYGSEYYTISSFSSWGVPGSLELKPEITAPGGQIWSVNGMDTSGTAYEMMSGTSMAAPHVTGMAALVSEYIQSNGLDEKSGLSVRHLAQSLLMSTAQPLKEEASGGEYYSILAQGSGLARVDLATSAESFVLVDGMPDGKVKVELGEDPDRKGVYTFSFTINNLNGEPMVYKLSADVFTQDLFDGGNGTLFLDTRTRALGTNANFYVNGVSLETSGNNFSCDLNDDGVTNAGDADFLLEYLIGNEASLMADGDVDGDGSIDSYDAHVLLTKLTGASSVTVPANGSVRVEVGLELTEETKTFLDTYYTTGAYIEAFVHAEPASNAEGSLGVPHSIPVLGYYGSWTEPSMYEVGSWLEYDYGAETRVPYLYNLNNIRSNYITINYGDGNEYLFGGNPFAEEDEYLPQRNAFNNTNSAFLQNLRFTQIRNASASKLVLCNADTGEIYLSEDMGAADGAYYHTNMGAWQNTQYRLALGLYLEGIPEGTRLNLSLVSAPELYCAYDSLTGTYVANWDALADGAYLTTTFTIDNTAPVLKSAELLENNRLKITAQDNEYIAAVALLNASGTSILTASPANQTERGIELTTELDLSYVFGDKFQVAVFDYAENQTVYEITLELKNERPYFTAIDRTNVNDDYSLSYVGMEADGTAVKLAAASGREPARAVEYVEGAIFEISSDNKLYAGLNDNLFDFTCLGELDPTGEWQLIGFNDLAYNKADGKLYGNFYSNKNNMVVPFLCTIDMFTGEMTVLGQMPIDANTMAIDGKGNFYSTIYAASQLYTYTSDVTKTGKATFVGSLDGYRSSNINSMAWDHNTDELYWAVTNDSITNLLKVDPKTGKTEFVSYFDFVTCGLFIAYEPETDLFAPVDEVLSVSMADSATTLVNNTVQLSAQIMPWNVRDESMVWTSSDPSVATVDGNGLVLGVSEGTATITATSVLDSRKSASCTVTVTALDVNLKAVIWDEDGQVWWSEFNTDTIPTFNKLAPARDNLPVNATMMADGKLYASTLDTTNGISELYTVDPETFDMTLVGPSSIAYLDMAYAPSLGYGLAVYFNYVVLVDLETGDYAGAWDWAKNVAGDLVGITYYGSQYSSYYNAWMDYFVILDADGNVYLDAFIQDGSVIGYFNGPAEGYVKTIGAPVDYSYFQGFHYDGAYIYWTRFNEGDNIVELIAWDSEGTNNVYSIGTFPEGVWPVAGLYTDAQLAGNMAMADSSLSTASIRALAQTTPLAPRSLSGPEGSLNNAPTEEVTADEMIHFSLPVLDGAVNPTNGTLTVTFDPAALELTGVTGTTEAFAWKLTDTGTVSIAFADRAALPDGAEMAELCFLPLGTGKTVVTVSYGQWNQWSLAAAEEFEVELPKLHMPFTDVPEGSFYYDPVLWAIENGITTGTSETTFDPNGYCLRASVVTFLWRASGCPEPTSNRNPFTDVKQTDFFYKAVLWAVENGITNGTSSTNFSPYAKCNRAQVVTFLWRAVGKPTPTSGHNPFTDVMLDQFYGNAVLWAVEKSITNGMGDGTFGVGNTCNRAQVVTFLYRTLVK